MKLQIYLFLIFAITLVSLGTWLMILFNIDPYSADAVSVGAFFATLLVWLSGILTLIMFYLRIKLSNKEIVFAHLPLSLRQAVLISLILVLTLLISSLKVFTWWSMALLALSIILLELFFRTKAIK